MSGILQLILSFCELEVSHLRFLCGPLRTAHCTALCTVLCTAHVTALVCCVLTGRRMHVLRSQSCWCAG